MGTLLPLVVTAAVFLALEWLWCRPSWLPLSRVVSSDHGRRPAMQPLPPISDPFALPAVRGRLDDLAAELRRLERDPTVFAKAFRTRVAELAYDALLAEAARLTSVTTIEMEITTSWAPLREELDV